MILTLSANQEHEVGTEDFPHSLRSTLSTDQGFKSWFEKTIQRLLQVPDYQWGGLTWPTPAATDSLAQIVRELTASQGDNNPYRTLTLAVPTALTDCLREAAPPRYRSGPDDSSWMPRHIHRSIDGEQKLVCDEEGGPHHPFETLELATEDIGEPWIPVIIRLTNRYYGFTDSEYAIAYSLTAELRALGDNFALFEHIESTEFDERVLTRALALMITGWTEGAISNVDRLDRERDSVTVLDTVKCIIRFLKAARETTIEGESPTLSITLDANPKARHIGLHLRGLHRDRASNWMFQTATTPGSSLHLTLDGHVISILEHAPFLPSQEAGRFEAALPRTYMSDSSEPDTVKNLTVRPPYEYGWSVRPEHVPPTPPQESASKGAPSSHRIAAAFTLHASNAILVTTTATSAKRHPDAQREAGSEASSGEVFAVQRHGRWFPWPNGAIRRGWGRIDQKNGLKLAVMDSLVDASFGPHGALLAAVRLEKKNPANPEETDPLDKLAESLGVPKGTNTDSTIDPARIADPALTTSRIWSRRLLERQKVSDNGAFVGLDIRRHLYAQGKRSETLRFQDLSRQQRLELLNLDGATIVDIDTGEIMAVGAIVNLQNKQEAGGGRASAARSLAKYGVAFKVSQDGSIEGWKIQGSKIEKFLYLG